ncbi:MAG: hypothetical protein A2902_06280 [Elusimicrobia bacterium RIFCSPLOWO2_01_FULL_64_13]|nr:MAG: hypothetical protein A2902_06280 [Elusimicrobia bacterium RIFCSPLOWO2_01_FULL_64_13]
MNPLFSARGTPPGVKGLLIANAAFYLLQQVFSGWVETTLGLVPSMVLGRLTVWQLGTYLFLHGGFFHLFFNMFALWMFGKELEHAWGTREFLKFYFFCGAGAGLFNTVLEPFSQVPVIGASGAIYGILVAFALAFPTAVIYLYGLFPIQARHFVLLIGIMEFMASFHGAHSAVARLAHLGGMLTGYFYLKSYEFRSRAENWLRRAGDFFVSARPGPGKGSRPKLVDLDKEVDRILEKVLLQGAGSLTEEERDIMRRYSRKKRA